MNDEELQHLEKIRKTHEKRLRFLEIQAATYGIDTPPHISTEIEDLHKEIDNINKQLLYNTTVSVSQTNRPIDTQKEINQPVDSNRLRVFLCHSSGDKPAIRKLYQQLIAEGFNPWLDEENLLPGQDWQKEIPKSVKTSDVVLVCLSHNSINKSGYVQKEIKYALDVADEFPEDTIFIIPLRLEECQVPDRLAKWHWVNLFEETGFDRLLRSLHTREQTLGLTASNDSTSYNLSQTISSREISFLTFDSRPLLNDQGKVWQAPYDLFPSIADLLNDVYFALDGNVLPFTYQEDWILRDRDTRHLFTNIGTNWARSHFSQPWDERSLIEVGIKPAMYLEIICPLKKLRALKLKE